MNVANSGKRRSKNGVICLVFMFPSWVMVVKLFKKVHFLQFCADLNKKSKSIKAIYIDVSERSCFALSENGIVYYANMVWRTVLEVLGFVVEDFC